MNKIFFIIILIPLFALQGADNVIVSSDGRIHVNEIPGFENQGPGDLLFSLNKFDTLRINRSYLSSRLLQCGLNLKPGVKGNFRFVRSSRLISPDDFLVLLRREIKRKFLKDISCEINWSRNSESIRIPSGKIKWSVAHLRRSPKGDGRWLVLAKGNDLECRIRVNLSVRTWETVLVSINDVSAKKGLNPADFELREIETSKVLNPLYDFSELKEKVLKKRVIPGTVMLKSNLVDEILIRRGQEVRLIFNRGSLSVQMRGEARENGRRGERIRVLNVGSNSELKGIVSGRNYVSID